MRGEVDELRRCIDAAIRERNESVESSWSGAQLECVIQAAHKLAKTVREVLLRLQPSPAFFLQAVREVTRIVPVRAAHFDRGAVVRSQPPLPVPELAGHILLLPIRGSNSSRRATCHSVLQPIIDALWKGLGSYAPRQNTVTRAMPMQAPRSVNFSWHHSPLPWRRHLGVWMPPRYFFRAK